MNNGQLKSLIERIERLDEEKKAIAADIKEVFREAKCFGFDPKIMRLVLKRRAEDSAKRDEIEALIETYEAAIGGQQRLPLGAE